MGMPAFVGHRLAVGHAGFPIDVDAGWPQLLDAGAIQHSRQAHRLRGRVGGGGSRQNRRQDEAEQRSRRLDHAMALHDQRANPAMTSSTIQKRLTCQRLGPPLKPWFV